MSEYFSGNPIKLDTSRSKYSVRPRWTGTWKMGQLVPIFATSLILPGDTFKMSISSAVRALTPICPVMDDMDMSIECYFVPHHLVLSRQYMSPSLADSNHSWAAFIGAQDSLLNMPLPGTVTLPHVTIDEAEYTVGGLADCLGFGIPDSGNSYVANPLKFLAYYSIWNEYFRDPSTMSSVTYAINSNILDFTGSDAGVDYNYSISWQPLAPTCRYHGYFGSALPWPQRNSTAVTLPLGTTAPVLISGASAKTATAGAHLKYHLSGTVAEGAGASDWVLASTLSNGSTGGSFYAAAHQEQGIDTQGPYIDGLNLVTDLSTATAATINQVRLMFQTQRWYEQLARSGNREGEITYGMFGVRGNDEGLKRPEYLGGKRIPISQTQVPSTGNGTTSSSTTASLGSTGAFSLTNDSDYYFTKSFTTWGTLMVVLTCRTKDSFGNVVDREDTKFDRFDYFWPQFANIGEQPVLNREISVHGTSNDTKVFGYQEAWAEYRMFNDKVTGLIRPGQSMHMMTYASSWATAPTLKGFLNASYQSSNVDRTTQVSQSLAGYEFYGQFQFNIDMVRPMPLYSIPGLIDHH